ncbi:hypothetical protein ILUMI_14730 [Ignelater luminosus]|uniref:Uncharacterized protein n=1 Tax=Ignelater luminosus TaxID=2038154 RepID=A0A8K0CPX6_IGNLU|nr:hypothetical protein ILUMI_14730 [Ignelater luminosus]
MKDCYYVEAEEGGFIEEDMDEEGDQPLRLQAVRQFRAFMQSKGKKFCYCVEVEKVQDLFKASEDYGQFHKQNGRLNELQKQDLDIGKVLRLQDERRPLIYLIRKAFYNKLTYGDLWATLLQLRREQWCPKLAMPKIGCGTDRLD